MSKAIKLPVFHVALDQPNTSENKYSTNVKNRIMYIFLNFYLLRDRRTDIDLSFPLIHELTGRFLHVP